MCDDEAMNRSLQQNKKKFFTQNIAGMGIIAIAILMILGMVLIAIEIFFMMGSIAIGGLGLVFLLIGIAQIFAISPIGGAIALFGSLIGGIGLSAVGFKMLSNRDVGLSEAIEGRVNEVDHMRVQVGDVGVAKGDLKLSGRIKIFDEIIDAESEDGFISNGTNIIVTRVTRNQVFVKVLEEEEI